MAKFKEGQYVYIIENNRWVKKAQVLSYSGGFYTLSIEGTHLTRLKEHRLFGSEDEANEAVPKPEPKKPATPTGSLPRTHHFYT